MNTVDRTVEAHTIAKEIFTIYEHFEDCEPSLETIKKVQGIIQRALESVMTEQGRELQDYKALFNELGWVPGIYWSPEEGLMGHDLPTNMEYMTLKSENERLKRDSQMLHDFNMTDATIAIQEREEIKSQRDALLVALANAQKELNRQRRSPVAEVWVVEIQRKNIWAVLHHFTEEINATNTMRDLIDLGHERKNTVRVCKYVPAKEADDG